MMKTLLTPYMKKNNYRNLKVEDVFDEKGTQVSPTLNCHYYKMNIHNEYVPVKFIKLENAYVVKNNDEQIEEVVNELYQCVTEGGKSRSRISKSKKKHHQSKRAKKSGKKTRYKTMKRKIRRRRTRKP